MSSLTQGSCAWAKAQLQCSTRPSGCGGEITRQASAGNLSNSFFQGEPSVEKLSLSVSRSLPALGQESTDWMEWISACPPLRTGTITSYWRMLSADSHW